MSLHPEQDYLAYLAAGHFMIQRAQNSGKYVFYPRVAEPGTGDTNLEWVEASGDGTVYSITVISQRPPTPDYNVALIDLVEGPRMMSRLDGIVPSEIKIGMKVKAKIIRENGAPLLIFEPVP